MPTIKVQYVGPANGSDGEESSGLTHNKIYTLLSLTDTKQGILLDDAGKIYLTANDLNTGGVWVFISASYSACQSV